MCKCELKLCICSHSSTKLLYSMVVMGLSLYEVTTAVVASESDSIVHMQSAPPPPPNNQVPKITTLKDGMICAKLSEI